MHSVIQLNPTITFYCTSIAQYLSNFVLSLCLCCYVCLFLQYLADSVGKRLQSVNLNQQTESSDLLGGFKPVDFEHFMLPVRTRFESLFRDTFAAKVNVKFLAHISRSVTLSITMHI